MAREWSPTTPGGSVQSQARVMCCSLEAWTLAGPRYFSYVTHGDSNRRQKRHASLSVMPKDNPELLNPGSSTSSRISMCIGWDTGKHTLPHHYPEGDQVAACMSFDLTSGFFLYCLRSFSEVPF